MKEGQWHKPGTNEAWGPGGHYATPCRDGFTVGGLERHGGIPPLFKREADAQAHARRLNREARIAAGVTPENGWEPCP